MNSTSIRHAAQRLLTPAAKRFIAGSTLREALQVVKDLHHKGFHTTLDHLGESVATEKETHEATEQYLLILRALAEQGLERHISVKPTQLGLVIDDALFHKNLQRIVEAAEAQHAFVTVDMEGSETTSNTLSVIRKLKNHGHTGKTAPLGAVVQAMLYRTSDDILQLLNAGITIRLCKGAYKEPESVAYQKMSDIRKTYLTLAKRLLTSGVYHGMATHDEGIIAKLRRFIRTEKIARDDFEFQMLYGIRTDLQRELLHEGWRVRIYIPFGDAWLPYTIRRLRERKENIWFIVKHLFGK